MDYKKVIKDYYNGTIDKKKVILVMDNDDGYWRYDNNPKTDADYDEQEAMEAQLKETYGTPDGKMDILQILKACGINAEWC